MSPKSRAWTTRETETCASRRHRAMALLGSRSGRPLRRHHHLLPNLLGTLTDGTGVNQLDQGSARSVSRRMVLIACEQPRRHQRSLRLRHVDAAGSRSEHRRHACDAQKQVTWRRWNFPDPVIEIAIEPKSKRPETLGVASPSGGRGSPRSRVHTDSGVRETISRACEWHLDIKSTSSSDLQVEATYRAAPQVAYRERSPRSVTVDYQHKKQPAAPASSHRQDRRQPSARQGFVFENKVSAGAVAKEYIPASRRGWSQCRVSGVLAVPGRRSQGEADRRPLTTTSMYALAFEIA